MEDDKVRERKYKQYLLSLRRHFQSGVHRSVDSHLYCCDKFKITWLVDRICGLFEEYERPQSLSTLDWWRS
jgi:hypothetical protein